jgi:hypothetical protein
VRRRSVGPRARLVVGVVLGLAAASGAAAQSTLPPGHPAVGAGPLTWTDPTGWVKERPSSAMRRAQYRIPGPGGDGECVVFYFGPGQGGDVEANLARWAEQFRQPDGRPSGPALKRRQLEAGGLTVHLAEISGTYSAGMAGGPAGPDRPNYMLLGAIAAGPDANWFFKATGPKATMEANRAAFEAMMRSLQPVR